MRSHRRFPSPSRLPLAIGLAVAFAGSASATTIQPLSDAHLVDRAAVVAEVTVEAKLGVVGDRPATEWLAVVDRVLKGRVDGGRIVLRLPGGERPDGMTLRIYGTPALQAGLSAIVFLQPREDGTYAVADFPQGAFLAARSSRRTLALRDFSEVKIVNAGRRRGREPMRDFERFADWIDDRARGVRRIPDYVVSPTRSELSTIVSPFTLFTANGLPLRWFEFDSNQTVVWRTHVTPMPGLSGGGTTEFQRALAVWTNEGTTPVRLAYGGSTAASGGLNNFDSTNTILWTDPNDEIGGVFDCNAGGTLAIGGPWFNANLKGTFNGQTYLRIGGGDIVFNDGVDCKKNSSPNFSKFIEEVSAHEVGHTLGIGHSSERPVENNAILREALMYFRAHDDARGARFNSDDVAALQTLYRKSGGTGGPKPPPPTGGCPAGTAPDTLCLLKGRFQITGTWQNQFDGSVGVTKPITNSDLSGFFYFTDPSNVELIVKILDFGTEIKVFYSQLTNLKFTLAVKDTATGKVKNYTNTAGDCGAIDPNFGGALTSAAAAELDNVTAAATGSCASSSNTLCLLDRRFAVTVDWRNQFNGNSGAGLAKTLSRFTGAFAFDDPANLEILIKTLDFGDKVLVLYGSLSNFEYTLHVTDTLTGKTKDYRNAAGNYCGGLDSNF